MSILNDLDPANSRIPSSARTASSHLVAWAAALLLIGGMLWIYFGNVFDDKGEHTISPVALASDVPATPPLSPQPATVAVPVAAESGAALILTTASGNNESMEATKQPNAFAALQEELASGSTAPTQATAATQAGSTKASQRTEQKSRPAAKTTKRQANKSAPSGQRQARSDKKPIERDIEIISAIVR
jgi:hypothetical protein